MFRTQGAAGASALKQIPAEGSTGYGLSSIQPEWIEHLLSAPGKVARDGKRETS